MKRRLVSLVLLSICIAVSSTWGQAPSSINYQGRLVQGTNLFNGQVDLVLRLYTDATTGTLLYTDSNKVDIVDGLYSTALGDNTTYGSLPEALVHTGVYLQVIVNGTAIQPREPVASVAHALMAWSLAGNRGAVTGANFIGTVDKTPIELRVDNRRSALVNTNGMAVGSATPRQQLSVGDYLDLYSGAANDPQQPSIRASLLGHLFLNARSNGNTYIHFDSGSNLVVNPNGGWMAIGTNTASAKLTVAGDVRATEVIYGESFVGNGAGLTSLDGRQIMAGSVSNAQLAPAVVTADKIAAGAVRSVHVDAASFSNTFWKSDGNAGTVAGTHFIGTTDDEPLDLRVNDNRALRLEPNASSPRVVGGYAGNTAAGAGSLVAGGGAATGTNQAQGAYSAVGGGFNNHVVGSADYAVVDGGQGNWISNSYAGVIGGGERNGIVQLGSNSVIAGGNQNRITNGIQSVIGGGAFNQMGGNNRSSIIGGGSSNRIDGDADQALIAGGIGNWIGYGADRSAIGGGARNEIGEHRLDSVIAAGSSNRIEGSFSAIGGGTHNRIGDLALYSVIPGGKDNEAAASYSLAAGHRAKALHDGVFIWADSQASDFISITNDEMAVRAQNGLRLEENAGIRTDIQIGQRFRDNGINAWGRVESNGVLSSGASFGVVSTTNLGAGVYEIVLCNNTFLRGLLIPIAIAEVNGPPMSASEARLITINQTATDKFRVYISDGSYDMVNNAFVFMATGR